MIEVRQVHGAERSRALAWLVDWWGDPLVGRGGTWLLGDLDVFVAGDFEDAAALLRFLRTSPAGCVEDYTIAGLERRDSLSGGWLDQHAAIGSAHYAAHQHSAMTRRAALHDGLMVRAQKEPRTETARVYLFEPQVFLWRHP